MNRIWPILFFFATLPVLAGESAPSVELRQFINGMMTRWEKATTHVPKARPPQVPPKLTVKVFLNEDRRLRVRSIAGAPSKEIEDIVRKVIQEAADKAPTSDEFVQQLSKVETMTFTVP